MACPPLTTTRGRGSMSAVDGTIARLERALRSRSRLELEASRRAVVAVALRVVGPDETAVLLIKRSSRPGDPWSGQISFPGGRIEAGDQSPYDAALRETLEEVGLDLRAHGRLLGQSDDLRAMARGQALDLVITPFVFELVTPAAELPFRLQPDEVDGVLWAPFEAMAAGRHDGTYTHQRDGAALKLPCYDVDGKVVWGLTFMMLHTLFKTLERADASRAG
jgi:8-oxo-dGTP pyrophosphatase MutT (NUDIX family)